MYLKKIKIWFIWVVLSVFTGSVLYAQSSTQPGAATSPQTSEKQSSAVLDAFEKNLDVQIALINKNLAQYSDLMNLDVTHTPAQSKFTKGSGYIQLEKYDFVYESPSSTVVTGGKRKIIKLYYTGQSLTKMEATIMEENYILRHKKLLVVTDPSPATEDNGDIQVFYQINKEPPVEYKVSDMQNTISEPNRIKFKKEFYIEFLNNLDADLMYTRKYVDMYGTSTHVNTIEELKRSVDY
ncbi:MAG: hypothetical protein OEV66_09105 [Spirochaetia bacterium]|nr:hypothetical protein [Spirochaetia bacterium]